MPEDNPKSIIEDTRQRILLGDQIESVEFVDASNVNPGDVVYCPTKSNIYILKVEAVNEVAVTGLLTCFGGKVKVSDDEGYSTSQHLEALVKIPASIYTNFQSLLIGRSALVIPTEKTGITPFRTARVTEGLRIISLVDKQAAVAADEWQS